MVFIVYPLVVFMSDKAWAIITNLIVYPLVVFIYFLLILLLWFQYRLQRSTLDLDCYITPLPSSSLSFSSFPFQKRVCKSQLCYYYDMWRQWGQMLYFEFMGQCLLIFLCLCVCVVLLCRKRWVQLLGFLYYIIVWCCVFNRSKLYAQHLLIKQGGYIVLNRHTGSLPLSFPLGCWSILQKINSSFLKYIM